MQHGVIVPQSVGTAALSSASGDRPSPFGVLFEREPDQPADFLLGMLGRSSGQMLDSVAPPAGDSPVPAGFTFLGQFIDHDITLMESPPTLGQPQDLNTVRNLRTPKLDLDSVFGKGPADMDAAKYYDPATKKLLLDPSGRDIVRISAGVAQNEKLIPERRNDENHIVIQVHVLFMRLYNQFVAGGDDYQTARRKTVHHYQNVVLHDYLPRIAGQAAVDDALGRGADRYAAMVAGHPTKLVMPMEFAFGAFRFGHTQIRDGYGLNATTGRPLFADGSGADLNGSQKVTPQTTIDWDFFFEVAEVGGGPANPKRNHSRKFDTHLSGSLHRLRPPSIGDLPVSLAERNLRRGRAFSLPSGQKIAKALGKPVLSAADLAFDGALLRAQQELIDAGREIVDIREKTPLWFYILREAELGGGDHLTGIGAWILAETFVGLLLNDPDSILNTATTFAGDPQFATMAAIAKNA